MSKAAAIDFLREQLVAGENERKKVLLAIQAAQARLPQIDAEVQAIKLLLGKHTGEIDRQPRSTQSTANSALNGSVSSLVHRALTEAGKPQRTEQLLAFLQSHGKPTTSATLRGTIHQNAKVGKLFKSVTPGVYGLIEWQQQR